MPWTAPLSSTSARRRLFGFLCQGQSPSALALPKELSECFYRPDCGGFDIPTAGFGSSLVLETRVCILVLKPQLHYLQTQLISPLPLSYTQKTFTRCTLPIDCSDVDIVICIAYDLTVFCANRSYIYGTIFLRSIPNSRVSGSKRRDIIMFTEPADNATYENATIATTVWQNIKETNAPREP